MPQRVALTLIALAVLAAPARAQPAEPTAPAPPVDAPPSDPQPTPDPDPQPATPPAPAPATPSPGAGDRPLPPSEAAPPHRYAAPPDPSGAMFDLPERPPTLFGRRGQVLLDSGLLGSLNLTTYQFSGTSVQRGRISLQPRFGYFVTDHLFVKLEFLFDRLTQDNVPSQTSLGGGAGLGYDLELGPVTSLLPAISLRYSDARLVVPTTTARVRFAQAVVAMSAYFLYHPAPHFYFGVGPAFSFSVHTEQDDRLGEVADTNSFGADAIVGVWW